MHSEHNKRNEIIYTKILRKYGSYEADLIVFCGWKNVKLRYSLRENRREINSVDFGLAKQK